MRIINVIVKVLTFPAAFLKGFWEHRICRMMGIPVESNKIFGSGEMAGHIEHELFRSPSKSFNFCFFSGLMVFLAGLIIAFPGLICVYMGSAGFMKWYAIACLGNAAMMFTNIFPSIGDAIEMWESYKEMNKAAKILLAPAAAIMYVGAYLETWGITLLTNIGLVVFLLLI